MIWTQIICKLSDVSVLMLLLFNPVELNAFLSWIQTEMLPEWSALPFFFDMFSLTSQPVIAFLRVKNFRLWSYP